MKTPGLSKQKKSVVPPGRESKAVRKARSKRILRALHKLYPEADCALHHKSALHLLVSTILSAQCTDDRVNLVAPAVFRRYKTAGEFAKADPADLEKLIKSTGFFRNKAKNIIGAGRVLMKRYGGKVPNTMEELLTLPGVARKTANVILGTWFKKNEGVVVDTHIGRLAHRLGLTWRSRDTKDAVRIEQDLMEVFLQSQWTFAGHALIWHGRKVCSAKKPNCEGCTLSAMCPSAFSFDGRTDQKKPAPSRKTTRQAAKKRLKHARVGGVHG